MADFHFLNPEWLLLFIPVLVLLSLSQVKTSRSSAWQKVIEPQLLQHLLQQQNTTEKPWLKLLSMAGALIAIVALANPVWEKKPESVFQTPRALVLVLDLSASMNAADLAPSRLVRARLKIRDILERSIEGQTGLVVFAGDAFSVAPLTRDNETIISQLRVLEPRIMPVQGSRVDLGLEEAGKLLEQAGIPAGDILVIADGFQNNQADIITRKLHEQGHRISFMSVGTPDGAPISDGQGGVIRDPNNIPVLARLDEDKFRKLSVAGGGRYMRIALNDNDIDYLLGMPALNHDKQLTKTLAEQNRWKQTGPYITLLLLPLAALAFRRGWLMAFILTAIITPLPESAYAFSWQDLWKTPEQQASAALKQQHHEEVLKLSSNPDVLGSAYYKQQQYQQAYNHFKKSQSANADYNQGNALARMAKYKQAIEAYDRALEQQPGMQDAIDNKAAIEALLKEQEQEQEQEQKKPSQQENKQSPEQEEQQSPDKNEQKDSQSEQSEQAEQKPSDSGQQSKQQAGSQQPDPQQAQQNEDSSSNNDFSEAAEAMNKQQQEQPENQPESDAEKESAKPSQAQQASQDESQTEPSEQSSALQQEAQPLDSEEQQAAEQWLRRIPDDPGGLLKRKFLYQYQQRNRKPSSQQAW